MRKILTFLTCLVLCGAIASFANAAPSAAKPASAASQPATITLTPDQARSALDVLNDPTRRAQVQDTLRAVVAAGALSTPVQASALGASAASAASAATGASSVLAKSLTSNGLASQIANQAGHWLVQFGSGVRRALAALLDLHSVIDWWQARTSTPAGRTLIAQVSGSILVALLPALILEYLATRFLRQPCARIAARGIEDVDEARPELAQEQKTAERAEAVAQDSGNEAAVVVAERKTDEARGVLHAARHWTLLQRLPSAIMHTALKVVPLFVFVVAATVLMSVFVADDTPQARTVGALIDVYLLCRGIVIVSRFFLAPYSPGLRLIQMRDGPAQFIQSWLVRTVCIAGAGAAIAQAAAPLGLTDDAHDAILKAVVLGVHVMIVVVILKCRRPVSAWIRLSLQGRRSFVLLGKWISDVWAALAVFLVMAVWFVWALDVSNGFRKLFHLFGISVLVLIAARVVAIIAFGALGRIFHTAAEEDDAASKSIAHRHAYRYYPFLRRTVQLVIIAAAALTLLQVWGAHVSGLFAEGTVGHRFASALITIGVAAAFAVIVWEGVNVAVEQRLEIWTIAGDRLRAARLTTLLPMMRTALFIVIAMVVVMTGLSEIGVNTGPLLASASIFGVALGFGSQKLVQDLITGLFLLMENALQVGDNVTLAGVSGTVEYLSIRTVRLRGSDGSLFTVPFSSVSTVNNTNRGIGNAAVRVAIALGQDVDLAATTLNEIGASLREDDAFKDGILADFSLWGVDAVDGASVTLAGQMQCRDSSRWSVQREFNRRIVDRFAQQGIEIANPQRNFLIANERDGLQLNVNAKPAQGRDRAGEGEASSLQPGQDLNSARSASGPRKSIGKT